MLLLGLLLALQAILFVLDHVLHGVYQIRCLRFAQRHNALHFALRRMEYQIPEGWRPDASVVSLRHLLDEILNLCELLAADSGFWLRFRTGFLIARGYFV